MGTNRFLFLIRQNLTENTANTYHAGNILPQFFCALRDDSYKKYNGAPYLLHHKQQTMADPPKKLYCRMNY
jgi:hypothetical protein